MTAAAGSLVVSLGLDAAQYTSGLNKSEFQARQFAQRVGETIEAGVALAIGSLGAITAAGATAFAALDRQAESIASFQGLSDKIGDTAENIASLKLASDISGVSMDAIAATSVKLTATLAKVDDESKGAAAGIKAIGLDFEAFRRMSPVEQFDAIAQGLAKFEDGAEKTAFAVGVLGKSGPEMLALFQDLADGAGRQVTLTEAQIQAADAYTKQTARLRSEADSLAQQTTAAMIPALSGLVAILSDTFHYMRDSEVGATLLRAALAGVTTVVETLVVVASDVVFVLKGVGTEIGGIAAQAAALLRLDFKGFNAISEAMKEDAARARKELDAFQARILLPAPAAAPAVQAERPRLKLPPGLFDTGGGQNPAKGALDNQLKALDALVKQEDQLLQSRNRMLDLYNGESLLSTRDYYAGKLAAQEEAVAKQAALYDREIAALERFRATAAKPAERDDAQAKINEIADKRADLYRKAGQAALEMGFAESKAARGLEQQMQSVNAQVLELTGNLQAASAIRLDAQYRDLTARLTAEGDSAGLAQVQRLKDLQGAQAAYAAQTEGLGRITEGLRIQEERIALSRQLGATTELGALQQLGLARGGAVEQMRAMVEAQEAIARASGSPALVLQAEQSRLALDQLMATANPVADKLNTMFEGAASGALGDFISGTKSAKDAFKSFANSIANDLSRLASQEITKGLFGGGSGGGGLGGVLAGLFSGGSSGGGIGSFFSGLFGRASGGMLSPGSLVRVNENGPELLDYQGKKYLMNGSVNARVTPLGGGDGGDGYQAGQSAAPNVSINIDARGADAGVEARLRAAMPDIVRQTTAAVQSQANRGGSFARAVGRRG